MWIYSTSSTTYGIRNSSDCQRDMDGCPGRAKVSNELSNYCGGNGQPRLDDPGSIGAPGIYIDAHLTCFTPKRSLFESEGLITVGPWGTSIGVRDAEPMPGACCSAGTVRPLIRCGKAPR
jgi:hypothetical protein